MPADYLAGAMRALIGREAPPIEATHAVEASEVRRFHHATLDPAPRYWDPASAGARRYGGVVAPPAFPVHALRRAPAADDPLDDGDRRGLGGYGRALRPGLPPLDVPLDAPAEWRLHLRVLPLRARSASGSSAAAATRTSTSATARRRHGVRRHRGRLRHCRRRAAAAVDQHDDPAMKIADATRRCPSRTSPSATSCRRWCIGPAHDRARRALVGGDGELAPHPLRLALRHRARRAARRGGQRIVEAARAASAGHRLGGRVRLAVDDRLPVPRR